MAGNGMGENGGKHIKDVLLGNGASFTGPPTFKVSGFVYLWIVL